ncbi:hypothetical protein DL98DRAFT_554398 [Cadophora sp. DSE1049]|nr:hypothetical protein DL98DRAFT_554398 [Cadophora sp. DSE1049]
MASMNRSTDINPILILNTLFPGFSFLTSTIYEHLKIDATAYVPTLLLVALLILASQYSGEHLWNQLETHFMSTADIRVDDELYNMLMAWVVTQNFSQASRCFVANIDINSRAWYPGSTFHDDEDSTDGEDGENDTEAYEKNKPLRYTPSFGTHFFWYKSRLILFKRKQSRHQGYTVSAREEISLSSFGRDPAILKTLLDESRRKYLENDENKTLIYRGIINARSAEPCWRRCMSRLSRPLSTIVVDEAMKEALVDDLRDYLHPRTRRCLSFAIAGHFKLRIYVVSLNTLAMNEQNLSTLFAELPRRCVVLLEDIDSAELTHTRQIQSPSKSDQDEELKKLKQFKLLPPMVSRISLSALLNVIDGVASQEGRILIMTTNHAERLDDALTRPGRVDMKIKFELASSSMIESLFRNIFSTAEGGGQVEEMNMGFEEQACNEGQDEKYEEKIIELSHEFAALVPADTFSPAEVQGFLLEHKRFPERAVAHAVEWVTKRTLKMRKE